MEQKHPLNRDDDSGPEPYAEPDPDNDEWPEDWTPKQKENWESSGAPEYNALETDTGRYWFRRTWRPKKRNNGMMERDHVGLGTPEDYIAEHVRDTLQPMGNLMGVMMRRVGAYSVDKDELEKAISDITQARISRMSDGRKAQLGSEAMRLADAYGLEID